MSEKKDSRKKALIIMIFVFLAGGGGIFIFFTLQGVGDLKGGNRGNFHYGFNVKSALTPLFSYFSQNDSPVELAKKAKQRLRARGLDVSLLDGTTTDVSDWMKKGASGGSSSGSAAAHRAAAAARTPIPVMGGSLAGISMGGGGSQTSAGMSKFKGSDNAGSVVVASPGQSAGNGAAPGKRSTLLALNNMKSSMVEGLQSGSAMTAKAKWDKGFTAGATGAAGKSGELAYGKSGLVAMDRMAKVDLGLKNIDPEAVGSLALPEPPPDPNLDPDFIGNVLKGSKGGQEAVDAKNKLLPPPSLPAGGGPQGRSVTPPDGGGMPPDDIIKSAIDKFCPGGCKTGDGSTYKDKEITYAKNADGSWDVKYKGSQDSKDYEDTVNMKVGDDGKIVVEPKDSTVGGESVPFGTNGGSATSGN